mmetsp:Transcript_58396/g.68188  ORF Transcript_58396/g.68188 Transcript_58396/m.68188 type:complete len:92 (-) Transcript_58396:104-379(-)
MRVLLIVAYKILVMMRNMKNFFTDDEVVEGDIACHYSRLQDLENGFPVCTRWCVSPPGLFSAERKLEHAFVVSISSSGLAQTSKNVETLRT